jgi:hypothetical protein
MIKFLRAVATTVIVCLGSQSVQAQTNNSLAFDGLNDEVVVPGASSLIANATEISLTAWVYPTNPAPNFPNFDGIAGLRNNLDADFYLLHYTPTAIEARFTNSAGVVFTLTPQVLTLNTWVHLSMTYDGSWLRVYKNGIIADSIAANGTITTSLEDFRIGNLLYQGTNYYLAGRVDEVSLWSRALSAAELSCLPVNGIDTANAPGLQLYYKFNQGTAGGVNTGITQLTDEAGNINGNLSGFQLTGGNSNFINGAAQLSQSFQFICPDGSFNFNGNIITAPGIYTDTLTNSFGCDSIVQLNLGQLNVDTSVTQNGATLTANANVLFYQWLDCNNGFAPVQGATSKSFTPAVNGSYAVIVQQSGCFDTSACRTVTSVGLEDVNGGRKISIYPTRTNGQIQLNFLPVREEVRILLSDLSGRILADEQSLGQVSYTFDLSRFASGMYQLSVMQQNNVIATAKIIRD